MEQMEIYDLGLKDAKGKILKKTTDDINISKKNAANVNMPLLLQAI